MGFRFRRSVRLLPGVRLNFSTRGISTSLGGRGATVNIGRNGTRATLGLPGTGLSYTTGLFGRSRRVASAQPPGIPAAHGSALLGWITLAFTLLLIGSCIASLGDKAAQPAAAAPSIGPTLPTRTVSGSAVNCRAEPKTGAVVTKLGRNDELVVLEQADGWSKVAQTGGYCWVSDSLLRSGSSPSALAGG